ncbi:MAG: hypothetical protein FD153_790 [Rhodospirillaceae bacterium]|nr:MAG: hypothetical protein FD153_790 [Rhodospirillaceae bacterium]
MGVPPSKATSYKYQGSTDVLVWQLRGNQTHPPSVIPAKLVQAKAESGNPWLDDAAYCGLVTRPPKHLPKIVLL